MMNSSYLETGIKLTYLILHQPSINLWHIEQSPAWIQRARNNPRTEENTTSKYFKRLMKNTLQSNNK